MKKITSLLIVAALLAAGCAKENNPSSFVKTTLYASFESTRASLQSDLSMAWSAGDQIKVCGNAGHTFTTVVGGAAAEFEGSFDDDGATDFYAVSPASAYVAANTNELTVNIPTLQKAVKGGVDPKAAVAVAKLSGVNVNAKNAVALLQLTVSTDNIAAITIGNAAGVAMSGEMKVTVGTDGMPQIGNATATYVQLLPAGEAFETGTYYVAVAPASITGGITVTFTDTDQKIATKTGTNTLSAQRSMITDLKTVDSSLSWETMTVIRQTHSDGSSYSHQFSVPARFSSAWADGTFKGETGKMITSDNLVFTVSATCGVSQGSTRGMRWGGGAGDNVVLPKLNGLTLKAVAIKAGGTAGNTNPMGYPSIHEDGAVANGGDKTSYSYPVGSYAFWAIQNYNIAKDYSIYLNHTTECSVLEWAFYYTGTLQPTITDVEIAVADSTLTGTIKSYQNNAPSAWTCGFEYKTAGQEWIAVDATSASFKATLSGLVMGNEYIVRAWAKSGDVKVYSLEDKIKIQGATKVSYDFTQLGAEFDSPEGAMKVAKSGDGAVAKNYVLVEKTGNHNVLRVAYAPGSAATDKSGVWWSEDKEKGLRFNQYAANSTYVELPAMNGLTLNSIKVVYGTLASSSTVGIQKTDGTYLIKAATTASKSTCNYDLSDKSSVGTKYRLAFGAAKANSYIASIELVYTGEETATVQYVCMPSYSEGTLSALVYVNSVTAQSDITGGFEYVDEGTAVGTGTFSTLNGGKTTCSLSVASDQVEGLPLRCWVSIDGGKTKVYSPEYMML